MRPLAAIYHPGGSELSGYPVSVVDFITNWSEATGTVTDVVCITTDGAVHTFHSSQVQIVDRAVAEAIVAATQVIDQQRGQINTVPPGR